MEHTRLEKLWSHESQLAGWSKRASLQVSLCLAPSTLNAYNRIIERFVNFCQERSVIFPLLELLP